MADPLAHFQPAVRDWFRASFAGPTPPQALGWPVIARGDSALLLAPTGSGKTLAAFLACIDRLMFAPPPLRDRRCRLVYISPLKALAVDVERNLRAPIIGVANVAAARGDAHVLPTVAVRTGDTAARERARFQREPADILITTPESLYLLLTSNAREALRSVETVIVDEIHALVPTKRGAHLALSLERLEHLAQRRLQRIGLSATQRPLDEVARFLGGATVPPVQSETELRPPDAPGPSPDSSLPRSAPGVPDPAAADGPGSGNAAHAPQAVSPSPVHGRSAPGTAHPDAEAAAGAIALVYVIGMALPLTRRAFLDTRYQIPMRAAVLMSLVTIPLATVVFEEVAFRSVLWGLLEADHGTAMATAVTSVLFGLWHVLPALDVTGTSTAISDGGRPPRRRVLLTILGTVLFTALAGVVFAELRRRSDSLVAPVLLHWATNGLAVVAASRMWKVSPPLQTPPPG